MRAILKSIIFGILILNSSCGLINGELLRPVGKIDSGSTTPPPTPTPTPAPAPTPTPTPTPTPVTKMEAWGFSGKLNDLLVKGSYVVAGGVRGLTVYDVTNPYDPVLINSVKNSTVHNISLSNNYAFVSYENGTLELLDITNPAAPVLVSGLTLTAPGRVVVQGSIAYVPDGTSGLRVLDFSNPSNLQLVTTVDTDGTAAMLVVAGTNLYLADGAKGLKVFDLAVSTAPVLAGSVATSSDAQSIAIKGNYAYVAVNWNGIDIIDISNKSAPSNVANYLTQYGWANNHRALEIRNNMLVSTEEEIGFMTMDISNPTSPVDIGSSKPYATIWWGVPNNFVMTSTHAFIAADTFGITTVDISDITKPYRPYTYHGEAWYADAIDTTNNRAFVCENNWGRITILDISDLSHPTFLGAVQSNCNYKLVYENNIVYHATGSFGMKVIDVSNPAAPVVIGSIKDDTLSKAIAKQGNYVYLTYASGLYVYDVSTPATPVKVGSFLGTFNDVYVEGNYAYLAGNDSLRVLNISNPASPSSLATYNFPIGTTPTYHITKSGNSVFLGGSKLWAVLDVSNPASPTLIRRDTSVDTPADVAVLGNKFYICDYYNGVNEYDITDFNNVKREAIYRGQCLGLKARNGNLFIADEEAGFKILNATSKPYMDMINKTSRQSYADSMTIEGNTALLHDSYFGVIMLDISNPKIPSYLARINIGVNNPDYKIFGSILYTSDNYGLYTFDISTPTAPTLFASTSRISQADTIRGMTATSSTLYTIEGSVLGVYDIATTPGKPVFVTSVAAANMYSLYVSGNYLFAPSAADGVRIFDISNPSLPVQLSLFNTTGLAMHVVTEGNFAYVADAGSGLEILDISNPGAPSLVGTYDTPGYAAGVAKKNNYVFVADRSGGVQIIDVSNPATPILKTNLPQSRFGSNVTSVTVQGNYLHVTANNTDYEVFDISDINNIHQ
ncbi:MAG: LVIVD repeat-containing protein [Bdellovibrio sp.]